MRTRFLLGPAGSGKTFRCLAEIRAELKSSPEGLPLVLLAPKQATFHLERQLLAGPDLPGYTRLQILSFERLAEFVLAEFSPSAVTVAANRPCPSRKTSQHSDARREFPFWDMGAAPSSGSEGESTEHGFPIRDTLQFMAATQRILDEEGRVMVLRALLAREQEGLKIYRATARLPGFAQQLSLLLRELQRHQHSPEKLFALATQIHSPPQLAGKLHDLALLLGAYHDWLKEHQLQDANRLLDFATQALRVQTARRDGSVVNGPLTIAKITHDVPPPTDHSALCFGGLWLDGFAEMTPQELDFLAQLTLLCARATLAFCLENKPAEDLSWLSTWSVAGQTFRKCYQRLAALPGCEVEVEILERKLDRGRFAANPVLAHLEENWSQPKPFESRSAVSADRELSDALRVAVCPNPDAEAVLAAREILRRVRGGGRYRDCAVLLRTHAGYHDALRRVFQRYEIPFFMDRREPVAHHPLAELTRYALRTVALGWEHDDWFGALKSGLVPGDEAEFDALENQALARGWKAGAWKRPLRIADDELLEKRLERLRQEIVPLFQQLAKHLAADIVALESQPTGLQLAEALRQVWY